MFVIADYCPYSIFKNIKQNINVQYKQSVFFGKCESI